MQTVEELKDFIPKLRTWKSNVEECFEKLALLNKKLPASSIIEESGIKKTLNSIKDMKREDASSEKLKLIDLCSEIYEKIKSTKPDKTKPEKVIQSAEKD